jgi:YHS domain-containing protein
MAIDPVCKMEVNKLTAKFKSTYNDKILYFCSAGCKKEFDDNPEKYIKKSDKHQPPLHGVC